MIRIGGYLSLAYQLGQEHLLGRGRIACDRISYLSLSTICGRIHSGSEPELKKDMLLGFELASMPLCSRSADYE